MGGSIPPLGTKQNSIIMKKDKFDNAINSEYVKNNQKKQAKKALEKAKKLEKKQLYYDENNSITFFKRIP